MLRGGGKGGVLGGVSAIASDFRVDGAISPEILQKEGVSDRCPCVKLRERKISPKFFRPKFFRGRSCGMSVPKCLLFFQDLEGLTEVFGQIFAGTSGRRLPLWAVFSFLKTRYQGGIAPFEGSANLPKKYRARWGIAAIVS